LMGGIKKEKKKVPHIIVADLARKITARGRCGSLSEQGKWV